MSVESLPAISLWQPWASALFVPARCFGPHATSWESLKSIETRGWGTRKTGRIAIHAALTTNAECRNSFENMQPDDRERFDLAGFPSFACLPRGVVLGTVELVGCMRMAVPLDVPAKGMPADGSLIPHVSAWSVERWAREYRWGDWQVGRFAWFTRNPARFSTPVLAKGKQGFGLGRRK